MKKNEVERLFKKLELKTRSTGNEEKILRVHYSHGKGDIPDKIVSKIRGQLKLSLKDFKDLIDCSLNYNNYINILKQKGIID
ncbi:hypothetical protein KsCSTR_02070 [Candidatus Kuenenia stuttgartiensis]|uniref:Uncharacterized protein n=1 Tax=Kuenenia stuttgartiensis TaxID=174633 RepID=A0A6G7GJ62_KUEST|nr:hypothetical protein [Candidatus Kuenenia stuttgartiensis]QII09586.1 hypothetical protein KsCSTR_02070 [Candidatus Kuenenia stuttgartiensis]